MVKANNVNKQGLNAMNETFTLDNQYCPEIFDNALQSILDNPTMDNIRLQTERLTDIEKILMRDAVNSELAKRARRLDDLLKAKNHE